ncbi:MAG: sulfurtransferase TusA family protein [Gammaproteobacteria bacterium]|nr:sulfurtransferase TusA family protein [Gammaproteobacteria bacterium]
MINAERLVDQAEIARFEEAVQSYLNLQIDPDRFMSIRLQHGVYGQRQDGVHMMRVKLPGGNLNAEQLVAIADVLESYVDHPVVHITTRQDIQIHYVPLEHTPVAMRRLAAAGLTTREACGNTVRNITACPLAGVCPREHLDITPVMEGATLHFLRHPLTQHLPRKFKISFSGCEADCAQGMMHDLGVVAVKKDGRYGFKVVAGGGLGHKPHEAITVEEFIEEKNLLASMEALVSLHHRYSDRKRRAKARIKFLVDKFGPEGFVEKYQEEYARTQAALADKPYTKGDWTGGTPGEACGTGAPRTLFAQKQPGLYVFPISIPIGDITGPQLRGIAKLMRDEGLTDIRATQDQNLMLVNVPEARIAAIRAAVAALGLGEPKAGDDVVACPGTSTCRLGITSSKIIGAKISGGSADLRIRASGCHNGCAQPEMGDIGIYGEGNRLHGKLVPHYQMYFGGDGRSGGAIALKGPSVPAARVEAAITRVQETYLNQRADGESFFRWSHAKGTAYFKELLADIIAVAPETLSSVLHDHGEADAFKVLQLGGGECAGAAQEFVASHFAEATYERSCRNSFAVQNKHHEALECAEAIARLVGESLLFAAGRPTVADLPGIAAVLQEALQQDAPLGAKLAEMVTVIARLKDTFDEQAYAKLVAEQDAWIAASAQACQRLDRQLNLTVSVAASAPAKAAAEVIDLSTYGCPLHYLKARNELNRVQVGDVIDFLLTSGEAVQQVSSSLEGDGHRVLYKEDLGVTTRITVKKSAGQTA